MNLFAIYVRIMMCLIQYSNNDCQFIAQCDSIGIDLIIIMANTSNTGAIRTGYHSTQHHLATSHYVT